MSETAASESRSYWKLIPGFAISAYFLWRTLASIRLDRLRSMHLVHPAWVVLVVLAVSSGYTLRAYRWWFMLRRNQASFGASFRVLLTSLAANNILPFRIGDFMRIFAYASDVNAPSSTVLSTVLLERLLDIFMLLLFLVMALQGLESRFAPVAWHGHSFGVLHLAGLVLILAAIGLGLLLFGTRLLHGITEKLVKRYGMHERTLKIGEWALLLFDAVLHLSFFGRIWLLIVSVLVWAFECLIFVATAQAIGMNSGPRGPWLAAILSNLSFLLPSAPGGIGPFEASAKIAMQSQGADAAGAAIYALLVHVVVFFAVTGVGGIAFLLHLSRRGSLTQPLAQDLAALPKHVELTDN